MRQWYTLAAYDSIELIDLSNDSVDPPNLGIVASAYCVSKYSDSFVVFPVIDYYFERVYITNILNSVILLLPLFIMLLFSVW